MKILIVYDSLYGNTQKVAESVRDGLSNDDIKLVRAKEAKKGDMQGIDMIIVGSPTHGGRPSQETKKFLDSIPENGLKNIKAAAFDTGIPSEGQKFFLKAIINFFGYAAKRIANDLKKKGANIIKSETFFVSGKEGPLVDGELERAKEWGKGLV